MGKEIKKIIKILDSLRSHCNRMTQINTIMERDSDCEYCAYVDEDGYCSFGDFPISWNLEHVEKVMMEAIEKK